MNLAELNQRVCLHMVQSLFSPQIFGLSLVNKKKVTTK